MMVIKQYGISLQSVTENDLEIIRHWRNDESVLKHMLFQKKITQQEQIAWFKKLDKIHNLYFIYNRQGVIHLKNIDWELKEAEAGIFTTKLEHSFINIGAIITLMDFAFYALSINQLHAKVNKLSIANITMNLQLGYRIISNEEKHVRMICKRANYCINENLRKWLKKTSKDNLGLTIELSENDNWITRYIEPKFLR
ncbi:MAG: GNAT family N-acetyltransferase [Flavobacteriales bacterium]|nr:GNAT family N-acetyltransferase [Flavobacteriales bacterium]